MEVNDVNDGPFSLILKWKHDFQGVFIGNILVILVVLEHEEGCISMIKHLVNVKITVTI